MVLSVCTGVVSPVFLGDLGFRVAARWALCPCGQETREKNRCQLTSANGGQLRHVRLGCDQAIGVGNSQEQF